jgi:2-keto-4-pentenoate hydratase
LQQQLGIGEPIFARIFDTGCFPCGAKLSYRCCSNLAVEGELAVRLGQTVSAPSVGVDECRAAITSAFSVIELHRYVLRTGRTTLRQGDPFISFSKWDRLRPIPTRPGVVSSRYGEWSRCGDFFVP